jgi:hypothetical protein
LGLGAGYRRAAALTGLSVEFTEASLTELPCPVGTFDAATCVGIHEHVGVIQAE